MEQLACASRLKQFIYILHICMEIIGKIIYQPVGNDFSEYIIEMVGECITWNTFYLHLSRFSILRFMYYIVSMNH